MTMQEGEAHQPAGTDRQTYPAGATLHLTPENVWVAQSGAATYAPERFAAEGFVHCTDGEALVLEAGNRYYRDDPRPYVLLDIDLDRVAARTVYEDAARQYPHIYGPLQQYAIARVRRVARAADGTFIGIGEEPRVATDD